MGNRSGESEFLSMLRDVKLPAQPSNRVPLAQQKSVPEFAVCVRRISAARQPQDPSPPAIGNFKQHRAIHLLYALRFIETNVRTKLNFTLRVSRRLLEFHSLTVM